LRLRLRLRPGLAASRLAYDPRAEIGGRIDERYTCGDELRHGRIVFHALATPGAARQVDQRLVTFAWLYFSAERRHRQLRCNVVALGVGT
jgi:hypothetical protein